MWNIIGQIALTALNNATHEVLREAEIIDEIKNLVLVLGVIGAILGGLLKTMKSSLRF